uniref:CKLF like MARVEL transmembrane domain containing 7 n=1 Tax=Ovis aries TaxID=9940 RepID=A0AC11CMQ2_SHEEP
MSHAAGLVRTTCSSGSAPGAGAGAGPLGASSSEGLLDPVYPRTHAAMLKVAQMATLLIAFICVRSSLWTSYSAYSYFEVVTICNLIMILAFYLVHLFRLYRVLTCISWPLSELLHYLIGTLLLLIASIVAASNSYSLSGLVAGAVFGFLATFLCLASVWLSYKISCVTQSTGLPWWSRVRSLVWEEPACAPWSLCSSRSCRTEPPERCTGEQPSVTTRDGQPAATRAQGSQGENSTWKTPTASKTRLRKLHELPWRFSSQESACNEGDVGLSPGLGRSPRGRHGNPP